MELHKFKFLKVLGPFLDLLEAKRENSDFESWTNSVRCTQLRVVAEPEQYLGRDLPSPPTIHILVDEIFEEFIKENSAQFKQIITQD